MATAKLQSRSLDPSDQTLIADALSDLADDLAGLDAASVNDAIAAAADRERSRVNALLATIRGAARLVIVTDAADKPPAKKPAAKKAAAPAGE